ncbi:MAG: NlpC/P60 family protein [Pseudomonadota bacterium]
MRTTLRVVLLLPFLSIAFPGWSFKDEAHALGPDYSSAFKRELRIIMEARPKYLFGGSTDERAGLDCSGYLFLAARRAGMPVRRTTARRMALGEGGWHGREIPLSRANDLDLVWWTLHPNNPSGHVGVFWDDRRHAAHASSTRGVVVDRLIGILKKSITKVRRLTLGE